MDRDRAGGIAETGVIVEPVWVIVETGVIVEPVWVIVETGVIVEPVWLLVDCGHVSRVVEESEIPVLRGSSSIGFA